VVVRPAKYSSNSTCPGHWGGMCFQESERHCLKLHPWLLARGDILIRMNLQLGISSITPTSSTALWRPNRYKWRKKKDISERTELNIALLCFLDGLETMRSLSTLGPNISKVL